MYDWRIRSMTIAFQLDVVAIMVTSSILLISVTVVFASPNDWLNNKNVVFFFWIEKMLYFLVNHCGLD
ncbi:hypothetical protein ACB098_02G120000 [Castanea mollissima]